jgi:hypothetical protein
MYTIILKNLVLPIWIHFGSSNEDGTHVMLMLHTFYWIFVGIPYYTISKGHNFYVNFVYDAHIMLYFWHFILNGQKGPATKHKL